MERQQRVRYKEDRNVEKAQYSDHPEGCFKITTEKVEKIHEITLSVMHHRPVTVDPHSFDSDKLHGGANFFPSPVTLNTGCWRPKRELNEFVIGKDAHTATAMR